jgi:hypothetical protein
MRVAGVLGDGVTRADRGNATERARNHTTHVDETAAVPRL